VNRSVLPSSSSIS